MALAGARRPSGRERRWRRVQIADPGSVMGRYAHQLSGGMQQRAVIAMALAKNPSLLILDEPTTGLDATVEAEVLDLVSQLQSELDTAVLFISHNLGVIAKMCSRVGVLYAGRLVEEGPVDQVLGDPRHPYTVGLLRCVPRPGARRDQGSARHDPGLLAESRRGAAWVRLRRSLRPCRPEVSLRGAAGRRAGRHEGGAVAGTTSVPTSCPGRWPQKPHAPVIDRSAPPVLRFDDLGKIFRQRGQDVHALAGASAEIWPGETLGLVGESGSGKTTLARALLGIVEPTSGTVSLEGRELAPRFTRRTDSDLRDLQIVFQNPDSALNRRHAVRRILLRALKKTAGPTGLAPQRGSAAARARGTGSAVGADAGRRSRCSFRAA